MAAARTERSDGSKNRVFVVDDHPLVRSGIATLIKGQPDLEICGEAADPTTALKEVETSRPDLIIVDLSMAEGSGLELIKQIDARYPKQLMLVLSMHDETLYAERALQAGAKGYVGKQEPPERLLEAMRQVLHGRIYLSPPMADRLLHRFAKTGKEGDESPSARLTDRELEVLQMLGQGLSTREIAERLNLSVKTIDTYREHLKEKLGLRTANELIRYAVHWVIEQ